MTISATSLHVTLAHAIAYLTRPLIVSSYPAATVIKLQLMLEANLTALYAPTWFPQEPFRGSGRRCLTLSPHCLPPRAIYSACLSAGVQWFDWITLLGGREFDFFVDPACVSVRYGNKATTPLFTVWSGEETENRFAPTVTDLGTSFSPQEQFGATGYNQACTGKTFAQQVLEDDAQSDEELFAMLADEINVPTWMTPILDQFPIPARSFSPLSDISSRSSSPSSKSSSASSFTCSDYTAEGTPAAFFDSDIDQTKQDKLSRRERARRARVFVDTSKTAVTPYDGGRTTVLTGGVMLGGVPKAKRTTKPTGLTSDWRSTTL